MPQRCALLQTWADRSHPLQDESSHASCRAGALLHEVAGEALASSDTASRVGADVVGWASVMDGMSEMGACDT